ncbi:MAG: exodeoxyribonuclease V subunit gamma [Clostridiales Family XIII bacterium]|jgi:ATP-dependent helicase/nuclease subunit B|nr:exodeoxyribonuclease V subunit gamma [Clostridiales Family XIII bacterium]
MLNVYTGREDIDKQRYLFERIRAEDEAAQRRRRIFLIVPDQFTLETERAAFAYMDVDAFINPVVLSMNRLAGKALAESGENTDHIDRYGKYMLLARLLYRNKNGLELYRNLENSTAFIEQLSEAIMSLKSHLVTPEGLLGCAENAENEKAGGALLGKKLRDLAKVYAEYEKTLAEALPDSTDITRRFAAKIPGSKLLKGAVVWIVGFDYFSPLNLEAIAAMAVRSAEVNVLLAAEPDNAFFALTNGMAAALADAAARAGAGAQAQSVAKDAAARGIDCAYLPGDAKPQEIAHIEQALFAGPVRPYAPAPEAPPRAASPPEIPPQEAPCAEASPASPCAAKASPPALRFVASRNYYTEAEAAAQTIARLIRTEGLRYRDILVLCNDQERRAPAIKRVFGAYGIETFLDKRHDAGYNPVLAYITALPEIISRGKRAEDVLRWIGTGLTDVSEADAEELENYIARYGLRGNAWHRPLKRGAGAIDAESFARIADTVKYIGSRIARFADLFGTGGTGGGTGGTGSGSNPAGTKSSAKTARARTEGLRKFLEEDAGLREKTETYADRLEASGFLEYAAHMRGVRDVAQDIFGQIEATLGDLVTSADEYATILRVGFASVMMGVLPAVSDSVTVGTMQRTRTGRVKAMFVLGANDGELPMFSEEDGLLDDSEKQSLEELGITAFRRDGNLHEEEQLAIYKNLSKPSRLLYVGYTAFTADGKQETKPSRVFGRLRALFPDVPLEKDSAVCTDPRPAGPAKTRFETGSYTLGPSLMRDLVPTMLSPTAIEKYSRCPFLFLMDRGLKLRELRKHELDSRGMGDIYHEALKRFGERMSENGAPATAGSSWNTASRIDTDAIVDGIFMALGNEIGDFPGTDTAPAGHPATRVSEEGALLFDADDPAAVYRRGRLASIVKDVCRALAERAKDSGIERMAFETEFGRGGEFEAVRAGDIKIAGRIDRLDILPGGRAKVLDYKSGAEKFNTENINSGWQLQLMLYLKAARSAYEPAGISYFRVFEPHINLSASKAPHTEDEIREAVLKEYRSDGATLEDASPAPGEKTMTHAEFAALQGRVDEILTEIAVGLSHGNAPARPKQKAGSDNVTACTYCDYLSICNYEAT